MSMCLSHLKDDLYFCYITRWFGLWGSQSRFFCCCSVFQSADFWLPVWFPSPSDTLSFYKGKNEEAEIKTLAAQQEKLGIKHASFVAWGPKRPSMTVMRQQPLRSSLWKWLLWFPLPAFLLLTAPLLDQFKPTTWAFTPINPWNSKVFLATKDFLKLLFFYSALYFYSCVRKAYARDC